MSRVSIVLRLTEVTNSKPGGLTIFMDGSWTSPPTGWLSVQNGVWEETPGDGTFLRNPPKRNPSVAELKGLHPRLATIGQSGKANYPSIAGVGGWEVTAINDISGLSSVSE